MGFKDRVVDGAAKARDDGFAGLRRLLPGVDEEIRVERFLVALVAAVRDDEPPHDRTAKDVERTARRRRQRLGALTFATGPLVGVASQLVDLYCDTATVCELAAVHRLELSDEEIAAHMLVLWSATDDLQLATAAMHGTGERGVAGLLGGRLRENYGPERTTVRGSIKSLWRVRALAGDVRERATSRPVKAVLRPGKPSRDLIARAERQLALSAADEPEGETA